MFLLINYLYIKVNINKCGPQLKFTQCGNLKQFKHFDEQLKVILCCYLVNINYFGSKVNINKYGYQLKFTWCGNIKNKKVW